MAKNHNFHKHYYEFRALFTLQKLFPVEYGSLIHGDKPDLFCEAESVGVEVVRAIDPKMEENSSFFTNKLEHQLIRELPQKRLQKFLSSGNELITKGDFDLEPIDEIVGYSIPAFWGNTGNLDNAIARKIAYLDRTEWKADTLDLYVFSDLFKWYEMDDIRSLVNKAQELQGAKEKQYRTLFVDDCGWFYRCDLQSGEIVFIDTGSILHDICVRAKETAERGMV